MIGYLYMLVDGFGVFYAISPAPPKDRRTSPRITELPHATMFSPSTLPAPARPCAHETPPHFSTPESQIQARMRE